VDGEENTSEIDRSGDKELSKPQDLGKRNPKLKTNYPETPKITIRISGVVEERSGCTS
jgi:hypothetical protein